MDHQGYNLGGGTGTPLTPEEVRRRRLATLDCSVQSKPSGPRPPPTVAVGGAGAGGGVGGGSELPVESQADSSEPTIVVPSSSSSVATSTSITPGHIAPRVQIITPPTFLYNDDEDAELQAALALSLAPDPDHATEEGNEEDVGSTEELAAALSLSLQKNDEEEGDISVLASTNLNTSCATMPSRSSPETAEWYKTEEPCDVLEFHSVMWDATVTTESDKLRWVGQGINFRDYDPEGKLQRNTANDSVLAAVISNHGPWGLTQAHGGPCGVLAAVQAELLRLLLFGGRDPLEYPVTLSNSTVRGKPDMSEPLMKRGLAMAMAIILARAALSPPAAQTENNPVDNSLERSVKVVLPCHEKIGSPVTREDFEPWSLPSSSSGGSHPRSSILKIYTIAPIEPFSISAHKRQRTNGSHSTSLDERIVRLAHAVSKFLLESPGEGRPQPLEAFRQPGGVVLLVMSLAFSRGTSMVHEDMDDQSAKLTTRFGHCGQELINLLLTGQSGEFLR